MAGDLLRGINHQVNEDDCTFISHALAGSRNLAEVRDAAGHANVSITSTYLHVLVDDEEEIGNLFGTSSQTTLR